MSYTITETKTQIADVLRNASTVESVQKAVVFERWILSSETDKWPGLLRSGDDLDGQGKKRTHGYVVELMASPQSGETPLRQPGYRRDLVFRIVGLHWHSESVDTTALFLTEVEKISAAFDRLSGAIALGVAIRGVERFAYEHDVRRLGNESCHVLVAELKVRQC